MTLKEIAYQSYSLLNTLFKENKIEFIVDYTNLNMESELSVKKSKLDQVIINLYKNAIDQLVEKNIENGYIKVVFKDENEKFISMTINDNGGGVPLNIIGKIFEPYFSTKSKNGTGIGLYMTKVIVETQLNGEISIKNNEVGASFTILLPKNK